MLRSDAGPEKTSEKCLILWRTCPYKHTCINASPFYTVWFIIYNNFLLGLTQSGGNFVLRPKFFLWKQKFSLKHTLHSMFALHYYFVCLIYLQVISWAALRTFCYSTTHKSSPIKTRDIGIPRVHWLTAVPGRPAPICQPLRRYSSVRL